MAVANSIARAHVAIDGGADVYINASVGRIGERAGQADLLSCIMELKFARDLLQTYEFSEGSRIINT
jgi:isopropylmalate/homocitrate/citramalate synthase